MSGFALGLIETKGLVGAIAATDAAAKAAQVTITSAEVTDGGLVSLKLEGDLAAVRVAVEAGSDEAERIGELISAHVIPRPDDTLETITRSGQINPPKDSGGHKPKPKPAPKRPTAPAKPKASELTRPPATRLAEPKPTPTPPPPPEEPQSGKVTLAELQAMPVVKLRQFARAAKNLPIQGRQISMANKTQLIEALKSAMDLE